MTAACRSSRTAGHLRVYPVDGGSQDARRLPLGPVDAGSPAVDILTAGHLATGFRIPDVQAVDIL